MAGWNLSQNLDPVDISFKDDVTVRLLLGVSFMAGGTRENI
jgi:hypothetical protein